MSNVNCEALDLVVVVEGHQTTRCAALGTWRPSTRPKPTSSRQPWYPGPQGGHVSAAQHQGCVQGGGRWLSSAATRATSLTQSPETPRGEEEAEQRVISQQEGCRKAQGDSARAGAFQPDHDLEARPAHSPRRRALGSAERTAVSTSTVCKGLGTGGRA